MKNLHTNYKAVSVAAIIGASIIPALVGTAANAAPTPFVDDNFYDCIEATFSQAFPTETIATTGLTDEQLAKITDLSCTTSSGATSPIVLPLNTTIDPTGIEKLSGLQSLTLMGLNISLGALDISNSPKLTTLNIYNTNIKNLDISSNPLLADLLADDDIILDTGVTCDPIVNNTTTCDLSTVSNLVGDGKQYTINDTSDYVYDKTNSRVKFNNIPTASTASGNGTTTTSPYLRVAADRPTYTPGVAPTHRVYLSFTPNNSGNSSSTSSSSNPSAKAPNTGASTDTSNFATIAISYFLPILVGVSTSAAAFLKLKKYH